MIGFDDDQIVRGGMDNELSWRMQQWNCRLIERLAEPFDYEDSQGVSRDRDDTLRTLFGGEGSCRLQ